MSRVIRSASDPARPEGRLTEDGRPIREVLSYSRRGGRLTPRQQRAWEAHSTRLLIPTEQLAEPAAGLGQLFGRSAPLIIEVGSGIGEATAQVALDNPDHNVLSVEVWRPGVAEGLGRVAAHELSNVKFAMVDAVWLLTNRVGDGEITQLLTYFPDPWPKARHHKRRLINHNFAQLVAQKLAPTGIWRVATDWADYATQIERAAEATNLEGGQTERWPGRPLTKFERRAHKEGREVWDFNFHLGQDNRTQHLH